MIIVFKLLLAYLIVCFDCIILEWTLIWTACVSLMLCCGYHTWNSLQESIKLYPMCCVKWCKVNEYIPLNITGFINAENSICSFTAKKNVLYCFMLDVPIGGYKDCKQNRLKEWCKGGGSTFTAAVLLSGWDQMNTNIKEKERGEHQWKCNFSLMKKWII